MDSDFDKAIDAWMSATYQNGYDHFLIREMGYDTGQTVTDDIRHDAFMKFRKMTDRKDLASIPTIRRWFGIGGVSVPSRESVYRICFALHADRDTLVRHLCDGLGQSSFCVNDYKEIILLYGLDRGLDYETCIKMTDQFEQCLDMRLVGRDTHSTEQLFREYEEYTGEDEESFLMWMRERSEWFRGYSQTVLRYMELLRSKIVRGVREETTERLKMMLDWAGYDGDIDKDGKSSKDKIYRFLRNDEKRKFPKISDDDKKSIKELAKIAFDKKETNTRLLKEVYSPERHADLRGSHIAYMSGKRLSDLFNIPYKKELKMRVSIAIRELMTKYSHDLCPDHITELINELKEDISYDLTVGEVLEYLKEYYNENNRRVLQIQRGDMLPVIFQAFIRDVDVDKYDQSVEKKRFREYADDILNACHMATVNEKYRLDFAILLCFQPDELHSYTDLLERIALAKIHNE